MLSLTIILGSVMKKITMIKLTGNIRKAYLKLKVPDNLTIMTSDHDYACPIPGKLKKAGSEKKI
ncbi:hypothetical protein KUTeg_005614 [Tegillarca granosa]|uniref:Uncharacterized protein n=1 Tax=Tegillarca granosa TaxID=220873 RepID=A0ABQ9FN79_TEGGR|nr:hypothetical protein KUTeg_005614 [Tegillarca granosa]